MDYVQMIGVAAGTLTTIAFLPQVIKTWRTKSAKGLSLGMFSIFCTGVALWLLYGFLMNDVPIILANLVTLVLAITLLVFKFTFKD